MTEQNPPDLGSRRLASDLAIKVLGSWSSMPVATVRTVPVLVASSTRPVKLLLLVPKLAGSPAFPMLPHDAPTPGSFLET
jgi:hypothetical protein